jgi:glycosyltransferase involved in cell wall biosynthesis
LCVHVRVHVVDPSAYTPPYDHALCSSLAAAGAQVELYTSRFAYAPVPAPDGYQRREFFYRRASRLGAANARRPAKLAEHVPDMLRYRRAAQSAQVVHFQWLSLQQLDGLLLPARRGPDGARRPLVLTAHDILPRESGAGRRRAQQRLYRHFDAVVVHSQAGRERLEQELGVPGARVHVIPHGALSHLAQGGGQVAPPFETEMPVVLFLGLLRPYKGLDVLLEAWRGIEGAELWIAGAPRMDVSALRARAPAGVRFDLHFINDSELRGYFRRADLVVLPYLQADQSGVLFTALAFGKPLLLSDVGGFPELGAAGAARVVPAGDAAALHDALARLVSDGAQRAQLAAGAATAARERYAWPAIARRTLDLYEGLLGNNGAR